MPTTRDMFLASILYIIVSRSSTFFYLFFIDYVFYVFDRDFILFIYIIRSTSSTINAKTDNKFSLSTILLNMQHNHSRGDVTVRLRTCLPERAVSSAFLT